MNATLKAEFLRVYANVPLAVRDTIVVLLKKHDVDVPITWNVAYIEVINDTPDGAEILHKLKELDLI